MPRSYTILLLQLNPKIFAASSLTTLKHFILFHRASSIIFSPQQLTTYDLYDFDDIRTNESTKRKRKKESKSKQFLGKRAKKKLKNTISFHLSSRLLQSLDTSADSLSLWPGRNKSFKSLVFRVVTIYLACRIER